MRLGFLVVVGLLMVPACASGGEEDSPPTESAEHVCQQIEDLGVGENCSEKEPNGIGVAADEAFEFDLPSVPGKGGQVLKFDSVDDYRATVKNFEDMELLAGPHRYGSESALIFVQMNDGLSAAEGGRVRDLVASLG